jgi:hypothetical protein
MRLGRYFQCGQTPLHLAVVTLKYGLVACIVYNYGAAIDWTDINVRINKVYSLFSLALICLYIIFLYNREKRH